MAKITATEKQYKALDDIRLRMDNLAYEIECAGQDIVVNNSTIYILSEKHLDALAKEALKVSSDLSKFMKKEVNPWV